MSWLQFTLPPMLHYIVNGYTVHTPGERHVSRRNVEVFDLLFVREGCLYIGEEERRYELPADHALILRPDAYHYGYESSRTRTGYYWLHFQTTGSWSAIDAMPQARLAEPADAVPPYMQFKSRAFQLLLPQFAKVLQPGRMEEVQQQLVQLLPSAHLAEAQFKQQVLFQEIVQLLSTSIDSRRSTPAALCAERAAEYLRCHYREEVTAKTLGEQISFHPVYIARCMQQAYGSSPMEYLLRYRIEQSKLLLLQTDYSIARIAEEVGFNQTPYFSSCFAKIEGISPRRYRQQYSHG